MNGIQVGEGKCPYKIHRDRDCAASKNMACPPFPLVHVPGKESNQFSYKMTRYFSYLTTTSPHRTLFTRFKRTNNRYALKWKRFKWGSSRKCHTDAASSCAGLAVPGQTGTAQLLSLADLKKDTCSSQGRMNSFAKPARQHLNQMVFFVSFSSRYCEEVSRQARCPSSSMRGEHCRAGAVLSSTGLLHGSL